MLLLLKKHCGNLFIIRCLHGEGGGGSRLPVFDLANLVLRELNRRFSSSVDSEVGTFHFKLLPIL